MNMPSAWFRLAAVIPEAGTTRSLRFADLPEPWVLVLVVLPALLGVCALTYWREPISRRAKWLLGGLRFGALALLVGLLCRPVWVESREEIFSPEVLVLLDDSASMRRQDAYVGDDERRKKLEGFGIDQVSEASRLDLARAGLRSEVLPLLENRGYEARLYGFSTELQRLAGPDADQATEAPFSELNASGSGTHLGDALAGALADARGRYVTDIVVVSDGRSNGGQQPLEVASAAQASGIELHTVVVGDTRPERNAILEWVESPSSALEGDQLAFTVRVFGRGDAENESAELLLEEIDPNQPDGDGALLDRREVPALGESGERFVLVAPPGGLDPSADERRFRIWLPPLEGETLTDDNSVVVSVTILRSKIRVLYVEGYPRWEYRRLALDFLRRAENEIEFQGWLASATLDFSQEHSPGLPSLEALPRSREEFLDNYDVVMLGDVNPYALFDNPADAEDFLEGLRGFVEAGGGLLFQAGERDNPRAFLETPLEELLPVRVDPSIDIGFEGDSTVAFRPVLELPGAPHEIVDLTGSIETNRQLWEDSDGLPGFYWYFPVTRAKPGAEVLLRHPVDENRHGRRPLAVTGYYPSGRTLFLAFDSTWRWQKFFGPGLFEHFWKTSIRWLALGRMRGDDGRFRLDTARASYDLSERVVLEARVLDEDYNPSLEPRQEVMVSGPDGEDATVDLEALEGRPGLYRGSLAFDRPGAYRAWILADGSRVAATEFEVVLPSRENDEPAPDPITLRAISDLSGGLAIDLAALEELKAVLPGGEERRQPTSSRLDDLWDSWPTLLLALLALALEWIGRKRADLL